MILPSFFEVGYSDGKAFHRYIIIDNFRNTFIDPCILDTSSYKFDISKNIFTSILNILLQLHLVFIDGSQALKC